MEYFAGYDRGEWEAASAEWRWMMILRRYESISVEALVQERDLLSRMRRQLRKTHLLRHAEYGAAAIFTLAVYVAFGFVGPRELLISMGLP
jgi:hypothetical protein